MLVIQYLVTERPEEWVTLDTVATEGAMRRRIVQHVKEGFLHAHRVMDGHDVPAWVVHLQTDARPPGLQFSRRNHPPVSLDVADLVAPGLLDPMECPNCGDPLSYRKGGLWCGTCRQHHTLSPQGRA